MNEPTLTTRVLILDDVAVDAELVERHLQGVRTKLTVRRVTDKATFLAALTSFSPELVLSDYEMPDFDGMASIRAVQELSPDTAVIIVTGAVDEETAAECIKAGAVDYVLKDHLVRLGTAVERTLEMLRERRERERAERTAVSLHRIIDNSLNEIFIFEAESLRFVHANQGALVNLGYALDELRELALVDITLNLSLDAFDRVVEPLREKKQPGITFSTLLRRKYGSLYPVEMHLQLTTFEAQPVFVAVCVDITQRLKADAELRESEERYRQIVQHLPAITYVATLRSGGQGFRLRYVSPQVEQILGYSAAELIADPELFFSRVEPEYRERLAAACIGALRGGPPLAMEYQVRHRDGTVRWVRDQASASPGGPGGGQNLNGVCLDITEIKRAETERNLFREVVEQTTDLIIIADIGGDIEYVNPAFESITGYSREEAIGRGARSLIGSGQHDDAFYAELRSRLLRGEPWSGEFTNRSKDGTLYQLQATLFPILEASGDRLRYVQMGRVVTREPALEAQARKLSG